MKLCSELGITYDILSPFRLNNTLDYNKQLDLLTEILPYIAP